MQQNALFHVKISENFSSKNKVPAPTKQIWALMYLWSKCRMHHFKSRFSNCPKPSLQNPKTNKVPATIIENYAELSLNIFCAKIQQNAPVQVIDFQIFLGEGGMPPTPPPTWIAVLPLRYVFRGTYIPLKNPGLRFFLLIVCMYVLYINRGGGLEKTWRRIYFLPYQHSHPCCYHWHSIKLSSK